VVGGRRVRWAGTVTGVVDECTTRHGAELDEAAGRDVDECGRYRALVLVRAALGVWAGRGGIPGAGRG